MNNSQKQGGFPASKPPCNLDGYNHSRRVLVYYAGQYGEQDEWGIAFHHTKPPFRNRPEWVDFSRPGRCPTLWWDLPETPAKTQPTNKNKKQKKGNDND